MNNYPGYSQPRSSSPLFPAYGRPQTLPRETELGYMRQQLYDMNDHFLENEDRIRSGRLMPPSDQRRQLLRDGQYNPNGDSPVYRRERYDFQKEQDLLLRDQRFAQIDRRNPSHFRTGDLPSSASHQSHLDYPRRSFIGERGPLYDDYNEREHLNQRLVLESETRTVREFNQFSKEVNHNNFPGRGIASPVCGYSDSVSFRSQSSSQDDLYGDVRNPSVQRGRSREEEILKEIEALEQQQKLQELLNVSLSLAKQKKSAKVLEDFDRESLSNNTSSSIPEAFNDQSASKEVFSSDMQDSPSSKPFTATKSNSDSFALDGSGDSDVPISKSTELKDSHESENVSVSPKTTFISESKITLNHDESPEQDSSIPFDSDAVLNNVQNSSASKSPASEWPITYSIPFLGENKSAENGLKSDESQKLEQASKVTSIPNHEESGESNKAVKSNLEDALETLEIVDPVVGLDFIIENKSNVSVDGSFPFSCQLCNTSITRSLIIDHILSYKHRLRYVKIKDAALYEHINKKIKTCEKEEEIYKAAEALENIYGRGRVVVENDLSTKDAKKRLPIKINFRKVQESPLSEDFELNKEIDLEQRNLSDDSSAKKGSPIFPEVVQTTSPTKAPADTPKSISPIASHGKSNNEYCKQVFPSKSEITNLSAKNESLYVTSPLKQDSDNKATVESLLSSNYNLNNDLFTNVISTLKRPASPFDAMLHKRVKTEEGPSPTERKSLSSGIPLHKDSDLNDSPFISHSATQSKEDKSSLMELLQNMTKWEISTNEEAEMISKTVDVLLKLLLQYKLQQEPSDDIEKLMKSFLSSRMENSHGNSDTTNSAESFVENKGITLSIANENVTAPLEVKKEKETPIKTDSEPVSLPQEVSRESKTDTIPPAVSASNKTLLKPPPFFCWPKSSTPPTSSTTAPVEKTNWTSQYTTAAAMYAYPQQGYGSIPPMYQPYTLPMPHCVAPVPMPMAVPMIPIPPPPKTAPPPLPSMKGPPLPPPPPPLPSGPAVPPLPTVGGFPVPPLPVGGPPFAVGGLAVPPLPPSTDNPPLPPSDSRPPLPP